MVERQTNDPLNYLGVRASTPPNLIQEKRAPQNSDLSGPDGPFVLGDFWLHTTVGQLYFFAAPQSGTPTWQAVLSSAATERGQATLVAGKIQVIDLLIQSTDHIFLSRGELNGSAALGELGFIITAGDSFVINAYDPTTPASLIVADVSDVSFHILRSI